MAAREIDSRHARIGYDPRVEHHVIDIAWPTFGDFALAASAIERYMQQSMRTRAEVEEWFEDMLDRLTATPEVLR